jgi:hypothetical protein
LKEEPVFSGGVVKLILVLVVAAGLGFGAYALAGGGVDLPDLPDLPDVNTDSSDSEVTNLENTTIEGETTLGETEPPESVDPFTTAGFAQAIATVRDAVGDVELTQITINDVQTQFIVRRGDGIESFSVRSDSDELVRESATITISGNATIDDFAFPLKGVQASAVDRMLSAAKKLSGAADFRPSTLLLERSIPTGSRALEWTINAQGDGSYLTYRAGADGKGVHDVGGAGPKIPEAARKAQRLNDCIEAAGDDTDAIFSCLDKYR